MKTYFTILMTGILGLISNAQDVTFTKITTGDLVNLYVGFHGHGTVTQTAGTLTRDEAGDVYPNLVLAYDLTATGSYTLDGGTVTCPRHGAQFDVKTGKAVGDAKVAFMKMKVKDVESFPVKVEGTDILVGLD